MLKALRKVLEPSDAWVLLGLALVAIGLWQVSPPAALVAVGVVLLWVGLPPRPPFVRGR